MQSCPPKYQDRFPPLPEKSRLNPLEHDRFTAIHPARSLALLSIEQCQSNHDFLRYGANNPLLRFHFWYELCETLYTPGKQLQCDRSHRRGRRPIRTLAPLPAKCARPTTTDKS
jgi:hypothetical protein